MTIRSPVVLHSVAPPAKSSLARAVASALRGVGAPALCAGVVVATGAGIPSASAGVFPPVFELADLLEENGGDGSAGFVIDSSATDSRLWSVSGAGDVNGDGVDDIIIGARFGAYEPATAYVVFGAPAGPPPTVSVDDLNGSNGFSFSGMEIFDTFPRPDPNRWVAGAGDINDDGFADVVIGASGVDTNGEDSGEAYVVFGTDQGFPAEFSPSDLNGTNGFVLEGEAAFAYTGHSVGGAGDVNGDGIDDLIVGARGNILFSGDDNPGRSYIVFGHGGAFPAAMPLSGIDGTNGMTVSSTVPYTFLGYSVATAGDFNGDGFSDVLAGAPLLGDGYGYEGYGFLVFGAAGLPADIPVQTLNGDNGAAIFFPYNKSGYSFGGADVSSAGDLNGDGLDDVVVGVPDAPDYSEGASYVVFGDDDPVPAAISARNLDGTNGFRFASDENYAQVGVSVSGVGDIDADGFDDVAIATENAGDTYLVFGTDEGFPGSLAPSSLDGERGFALRRAESNPSRTVRGAGDVNGDGVADVILGAFGQAYVVYGRADGDGDGVENAADNCTGVANSGQRDSNGDGFGNLCDADLNGDCSVNFADLAILKSAFFSSDADADLDGNGTVSFLDLALMKAGFFAPPGPSGLPTDCD